MTTERQEPPYSRECPFCGYRWPLHVTVTDSPGCPDCGGTDPGELDPIAPDPEKIHDLLGGVLNRIRGRRAGIARAALIVWDEDEHRN